jgi:hypothetical protein
LYRMYRKLSSVLSCTACLRMGRSPVQGIYHFSEELIFSEVNCEWEEARQPNS